MLYFAYPRARLTAIHEYDAIMHETDVRDADEFLAGYKSVSGYHPDWALGSWGWQIRWPVIDAHGVSRGTICIEVDRLQTCQSFSLIFGQFPLYRLDLTPDDHCHENKFGAHRKGLPPLIYGTHAHTWTLNRDWNLFNLPPSLPYAESFTVNGSNFSDAFSTFSDEIGLTYETWQGRISLPPQREMFR